MSHIHVQLEQVWTIYPTPTCINLFNSTHHRYFTQREYDYKFELFLYHLLITATVKNIYTLKQIEDTL